MARRGWLGELVTPATLDARRDGHHDLGYGSATEPYATWSISRQTRPHSRVSAMITKVSGEEAYFDGSPCCLGRAASQCSNCDLHSPLPLDAEPRGWAMGVARPASGTARMPQGPGDAQMAWGGVGWDA